jgi:UrcA family protein
MKSRLNVYVMALLAGAAMLSTGAIASPLSERALQRSETVKYSPSKATTIEGAMELYEKLHSAAVKVCSSDDRRFSVRDMQDSYDACATKALGKAVARVHSPLLTALHIQGTSMKIVSARQGMSTIAQR